MRTRRAGLGSAILAAAAVAVVAIPVPVAQASPAGASERPTRGIVEVAPATDAERSQDAATIVDAMSASERAASIVMGHVPTADPAIARDYVSATEVGGFILMGSNVADEAQLAAMTAAIHSATQLPPLIAVDQEGGIVRRLTWDGFPSSLDLKGADASAVQAAFAGRGALVARAGIDVNFGVVADWTSDTSSFIFERALGVDPGDAADRVAAATGGEDPFVATTLKHFPGHGAAPGDSHFTIPETAMSLDEWRSIEAAPFRAGIDAGAPFVMFGHLAYTSIDAQPASLSAEWHRILRDDLGFTGVAVTDDMAMLEASGRAELADPLANAVAAVAAGNDLVLGVSYTTPERVGAVVDGIVGAVDRGELDPARLREAALRVAEARLAASASMGSATLCVDCVAVG